MSAETEHVLEILAQKLIESLTPGRDTIKECVRGLWSHLRSAGMRGQDLMTAQSFLIRLAEEAHIPWMEIDASFHGEGKSKKYAPVPDPQPVRSAMIVKRAKR